MLNPGHLQFMGSSPPWRKTEHCGGRGQLPFPAEVCFLIGIETSSSTHFCMYFLFCGHSPHLAPNPEKCPVIFKDLCTTEIALPRTTLYSFLSIHSGGHSKVCSRRVGPFLFHTQACILPPGRASPTHQGPEPSISLRPSCSAPVGV